MKWAVVLAAPSEELFKGVIYAAKLYYFLTQMVPFAQRISLPSFAIVPVTLPQPVATTEFAPLKRPADDCPGFCPHDTRQFVSTSTNINSLHN